MRVLSCLIALGCLLSSRPPIISLRRCSCGGRSPEIGYVRLLPDAGAPALSVWQFWLSDWRRSCYRGRSAVLRLDSLRSHFVDVNGPANTGYRDRQSP